MVMGLVSMWENIAHYIMAITTGWHR